MSNELVKESKKKPKRTPEKINGQAKTPIRTKRTPKAHVFSELLKNNRAATTPEGTIRFKDLKEPDEKLPYYHGLLPREDIRAMLMLAGDYLLRTTEHKVGQGRDKCLSVMWHGELSNFILAPKQGQYTVENKPDEALLFPTIEALVNHYSKTHKTFGLKSVQLINPIYKKPWELEHFNIELDKKLGAGAFGEVYSGFLHRKNKRKPVAVKTLKGGTASKEKIEEQMKEARLMRPLRHTNVVRFYGVAVQQEPLMIVMELVDGGSLDSYLQKNGPDIGIPERNHMCLGAALGVEYIHTKGIIHRDIASRNCLYGNGIVKLSDFGMSRKAALVKQDRKERVPVRWLAPEVFCDMEYTKAADIIIHGFRLSLPDWAPDEIVKVFKLTQKPKDDRITAEKVARALEPITSVPNDTATSTVTSAERLGQRNLPENSDADADSSKISHSKDQPKEKQKPKLNKKILATPKQEPRATKSHRSKESLKKSNDDLLLAKKRSPGTPQHRSLMVKLPGGPDDGGVAAKK